MDFGRLQVEFGIRNGNDEYRIIYLRGLLSMVFLPNINNIQYPMGRKWLTLAVTSAGVGYLPHRNIPQHNSSHHCIIQPSVPSILFFSPCISFLCVSLLCIYHFCCFIMIAHSFYLFFLSWVYF